jgi:hypothetical protein
VHLVALPVVRGFLSPLGDLRYRNLLSLGLSHGAPTRAAPALAATLLFLGGACRAAAQRAAADSAPLAPGCTTAVTRAGLSAATGARIQSVRVVTHPPRPFRGPARHVNRLHARTVAGTVRRELLFAAGDTVDSLQVAESLRRLRNLGFIADAWLRSTRCGSGRDAAVSLVVETRDAWSTVPEAYWSTTQQTLGVHETNLLGTGRTLSAVLRWDADRLGESYRFGGQLGISDPALTRTTAAGASYVAFIDGRAWALAAGSRRRGLADRWIGRGSVSQAVRDPTDGVSEQVRRDRAAGLVGRRISPPDAAPTALYLLGGAEAERTAVAAASGAALVGPAAVRRTFVGPIAGVALRAVRFDTLTWLLPRDGIADIPRGTEAEVVVGGGRDLAARAAAVRVDGWVGRVWRPGRRSLVATDLWAGGYANGARDAAGGGAGPSAARGGVSAFRAAPGGLWTARLGAERRVRPDPDARSFVGFDPTATLVDGELRLAVGAAAASVERSRHIRPVTRTLVLDAALFGAVSRRSRPASRVAGDAVTLGLVGVGVRLAPTRPGQPTAGLDLGYPVIRPGVVAARPVARVLVAPWFGSIRGR